MKTFLAQIKSEIQQKQKANGQGAAASGTDVSGRLAELVLAASGSFARGYHLEFSVENENAAREVCNLLAAHDIFAHMALKKQGGTRVYIKDSESICNLLALVGANKSLYQLNDQIVLRSVRNLSNRKANCDAHNIGRAIETAAAQIKRLSTLSPESLSPELSATLTARRNHPDATYDELAAVLGVSKSGVVFRINRLLALCDTK
jgi:DNA-binding protein WhiA